MACAVTVATPSADAIQAESGGGAIIVSADTGNRPANLYRISSIGQAHRLDVNRADETDPALSPDGREIVYVHSTRANCDRCGSTLWIANADGTGAHALTAQLPGTDSFDQHPTWAPDGNEIVFARQTLSSYELYRVAASGGTPRDLFIPGISPAWGPTRIAYLGPPPLRPGPDTLWTVKPDGTDPVQLTTDFVVSPAWSSKGTLAYLVQPPTGPATLVVSTHHFLLPVTGATSLAWSPGGNQLAITAQNITAQSTPSGHPRLYIVNADGTAFRPVHTTLDALGVTWGTKST